MGEVGRRCRTQVRESVVVGEVGGGRRSILVGKLEEGTRHREEEV